MTDAIEHESMQFDVLIVGAGPAGLSTAIKLKQLAAAEDKEISVCLIDKAAEIGGHTLSGAVIDPVSLTELIPDWAKLGAPLTCEAKEDNLVFLTKNKSFRLPTPPSFSNHGNYIISLGALCRWLSEQAENLDVEIYPGFPASEVLFHEDGSVKGIMTGDMGRDKDGQPTDNFQAGMALLAQQTVFAEGCRGSLSKEIISRFDLNKDAQTQVYGIGIKEIWEVLPEHHQAGKITHTVGWPLDSKTFGGSFMYHLDDNKVTTGFVVGLDYSNPYLSPFEEFQRFKTHPDVLRVLKGGRRLEYGSRALSEGGLQSLPKFSFPGGVLVGDCAGFLNVPRIKGIHTSMKSGILAAEAVFSVLEASEESYSTATTAQSYDALFKASWLYRELYKVRNIRPAFKWGMWGAFLYGALDEYVLRGKAPWTLKHHMADHLSLKDAKDAKQIDYPKPDGEITFDRLSSVYLSNTFHEENQACHLQLKNPALAIDINYARYASPEIRYCPAAVYEIIETDGKPLLHINAQNCLHCKTCDIKDPTQNINWTCPEGGGGPNYSMM